MACEDGGYQTGQGDDETRFRTIIERNADGVVVVCPDGDICFVNPAATALLGRPAKDLLGTAWGIPIIPGEITEVDIPRPGGEVRVAEMRVVETEWEGEHALLASLRDVTERKHLQDKLQKQAEALIEADRHKNEFLAMLAHELRNPLAPILNAVHIMRLSGDDPAALEQARDMVEQQVRHMSRLVDDLLDISRITRGKIQLRKDPMDLKAATLRVADAIRPRAKATAIALDVEMTDTPITLEADPTRIEQVITNLLSNALKYNRKGGHVRLVVEADAGEAVIRVEDDGIGIAPDMLPRVFDLFAQADRSLDRSEGGLGIGLTLARSLVRMHDGVVEALSPGLGLGSTFVVRLPLPATPPATPEPRPAEKPTEKVDVAPLRVLIVDDNVHAAQSLSILLGLWHHDARVAHDGFEGLKLAAEYGPDVVLLDIGLPRLDGYQVARRLREAEGPDAGTLIVAMTGYGQDKDRAQAFEAGFDHHMVKPVDLHALEDLLSRHSTTRRVCAAASDDVADRNTHAKDGAAPS